MTETTINGVVIETSQPIIIRDGVVECGTDPETRHRPSLLLDLARDTFNQQLRNMTLDEQMIRNQRTRGYNCFGNLY